MRVPTREYDLIADFIQSADSPVGIDAKKTHVYIIHTLHDIQNRLSALEKKFAQSKNPPQRKKARPPKKKA